MTEREELFSWLLLWRCHFLFFGSQLVGKQNRLAHLTAASREAERRGRQDWMRKGDRHSKAGLPWPPSSHEGPTVGSLRWSLPVTSPKRVTQPPPSTLYRSLWRTFCIQTLRGWSCRVEQGTADRPLLAPMPSESAHLLSGSFWPMFPLHLHHRSLQL